MQQSDKSFDVFSKKDIEILNKETLFSGFFKMIKYRFKHKKFSGDWSDVLEREMFVRTRASAMIPYDPMTDNVVLIEQIRVGALEHPHPWQLEIVAGIIDKDESPEDVVRREAFEEAGLDVKRVEKITAYYPSSGGCNEMLDVFVGEVDSSKAGGIHGLDEEGEDIKVHIMSREEAYELVKNGKIENGASIIALQWLELNRNELKDRWQES
ncbi:ADP-ribose diphosphatase [Vibrio salinus]|uniref:ADP-ribose diphosphatase n=1 Tax=Vibrio salinus TaxID=2899784 RepID=UPI001E65DB2F|nr:ADP-ribose diphosphatase [Vibrio salinus]MCE0493394.1 ADP-ribose diphosphatase [Vibrio salinus]